jgi:hypothetical protein
VESGQYNNSCQQTNLGIAGLRSVWLLTVGFATCKDQRMSNHSQRSEACRICNGSLGYLSSQLRSGIRKEPESLLRRNTREVTILVYG